MLSAPKVTRPARAQHKAVRLLHFRVLCAPHAAACELLPAPPSSSAEGVGWPPRGCCRSRESFWLIPGEVPSSQGQYVNSGWQQRCLRRGEASPVSLLPSGKPLECEKRHLSCQGEPECKQSPCPAHTAGSELSACHAGIATVSTHMPSTASQAFPGTLVPELDSKGGSLNPSHALRSLKMLCFLSEIKCQIVLMQKEGMKLRPGCLPRERRAHVWTPIHLFLMLSGKRHNKRIAELGMECQVPLPIIIKIHHY